MKKEKKHLKKEKFSQYFSETPLLFLHFPV